MRNNYYYRANSTIVSNFKLSLKLFLILFLFTVFNAGAQNRIEWKEVAGADHYLIEIKQNDKIIIKTGSDVPYLPLFLPPGEYYFKIKAINTFGKISSESEWKKLKISEPPEPFIIDLSPSVIYEKTDTELTANIYGFTAETVFYLEDTNGTRINTEISGLPNNGGSTDLWKKIILIPEKKHLKSGTYSLVMENPDGKTSILENSLNVKKRNKPKIIDFTPGEFKTGENDITAVLRVSGVYQDSSVSFEGPTHIPFSIISFNENSFTLNMDFTEAEPGWYSVSVINASGEKDYKKNIFKVQKAKTKPEEPDYTIEWMNEYYKREPYKTADFPNSVSAGWNFTFPLGKEVKEYYREGYTGFSFEYSKNIRNRFLKRLRGFEKSEWGLRFNYSRCNTAFPILDVRLNRFDYMVFYNYVSPFKFPLNFIIKTGAGFSYSMYTSPDTDRNSYIGNELKKMDSIDFIISLTAGGRINIGKKWYIDVLCSFPAVFYFDKTLWTIQPELKGGWKW